MELLGQLEMDQKQKQVNIVSIETFYKPLTPDQESLAKRGLYNFDHPGIFTVGFLA